MSFDHQTVSATVLTVLAVAYGVGVDRLWRRSFGERVVPLRAAACFLAGAARDPGRHRRTARCAG